MPEKRDLVFVVDFGGQYTQLIARRIRELKVYCEIVPYTATWAELRERTPRGLVFSGGPASVYAPGAPRCDPALLAGEVPVLGICYGMQLMAHLLGGKVKRGEKREYGPARLTVIREDALFRGLPREIPVWMSHGDRVEAPPPGFLVAAATSQSPVAAMFDPARKLYGVQFHPEVHHTPQGKEILAHFLYEICGCRGDWTPASFVAEQVEEIRRTVGSARVVGALSGGVDSTVAATLVHRAVGDRLTCIFVDHGLLRKGEKEDLAKTFHGLGIRTVVVDAGARFLEKLQGVTDPEEKRRIIGREFIRVFEEEAARLGEVGFLLQGTLYPDVIESGTQTAAVIKTHHNVGGIPADLKLQLLEPLRWLFKDEVRRVGLELGLPEAIIWRQPFPGPGLAVRVLGEVTREKLEVVREADWIVTEEIRRAGLDREIWQFFAVLLPVRSVGVMGDERTYAHPVVVRAVTSEDAMTADWARLPFEVLARISSRIVNEVPGVNRVLYDITSKPPATIEWE
ncbi:MAG: glutamine-hydrolyzing GMP synthase [Firmicutes bacterium]|nr:glutamine-hydrolyzing GMP synthase [Bacillota bacterium]